MPRILHTSFTAFESVVTRPYRTRRRKEYTRFIKRQCIVTSTEAHHEPASNGTFYGVFKSDDPEFADLNDKECDLSVYTSSKSIVFRRSLLVLPLAMFRITGVEFQENGRLININIDDHSVIQFRCRHQNDFVTANGVFNNHRNDFSIQRNQVDQFRDLINFFRTGLDRYERNFQRNEAAVPRIPIVPKADDDDAAADAGIGAVGVGVAPGGAGIGGGVGVGVAPGGAGGGGGVGVRVAPGSSGAPRGDGDAALLRRSRSGSRSSDSGLSSSSSVSLSQEEDRLSVESGTRRRSTRGLFRQQPYHKK